MREFDEILEAVSRGEGTWELLSDACDRILAKDPGQADALLSVLGQARDAGLSHAMFVALSSRVQDSTGQPAHGEFGGTVVLPGSPLAAQRRGQGTATPGDAPATETPETAAPPRDEEGDDEPTIPDAVAAPTELGDSDRTAFPQAAAGIDDTPDADVTALETDLPPAPDRDATRLLEPGETPEAGDATQVGASTPDASTTDATIVGRRAPPPGPRSDDTVLAEPEPDEAGDARASPAAGPAAPDTGGGVPPTVESDETILAQARRRPRQAPPATRTPTGGTEAGDATILAPPGDSTVIDAGTAGAGPTPDDATVLQADDATVLPPQGVDARPGPDTGTPPSSDDATLVGATGEEPEPAPAPSPDDDATLMDVLLPESPPKPPAGTGDVDESTEVNPSLPGHPGLDVTEVNRGTPSAEDITAVDTGLAGEADRTEIAGDDEALDILDPAAMEAAARSAAVSQTGPDWPTGGPDDMLVPAVDGPRDYGPGDVLKQRFRLIAPLGEGGMGTVWKAIDLLKEEARDRNPYVAVKLLSGDFKEHPEAFIALQREASKAQRLAHPNITTVYDFDRDGETVYLTMEVLEGQPLNAFIRKLPAGGLPENEAMPLINQLGAGLAYAHERKLVHSDLKPGNAFLTSDGTVKLLDFGIARASKTKGDAAGEKTLFDPGKLGALTPAYATPEMFEGLDPDPRDDIYALACISFELLTGKHPFNKLSAPKARDQNLVPPSVAKLSRRQNKALKDALAFDRDGRTGSVSNFLEQLRRRQSNALRMAAAGVVALFIMGGLAYVPIADYLRKQENEAIIAVFAGGSPDEIREGLDQVRALEDETRAERVLDDDRVRGAITGLIARGDEQSIRAALALIQPFDDDWQVSIKNDQRARRAIFALYTGRRDEAVNPGQGRFDYPEAEQQVDRLEELFPDSAEVFRIRTELQAQKDNDLAALNDKYNQYLDEGLLLPDPDAEDVTNVLEVVAQIDPDHPLLSDRQLPIRYADLTQEAMAAGDYARAGAILEASIRYAPDDATLRNLRDDVQTELRRIQSQQEISEIAARLEAEQGRLETLSDFQRVRDDLARLADLDPSNALLTAVQDALRRSFDVEMQRLVDAGSWDESEALLVEFARLLDLRHLVRQRRRLDQAEADAGYSIPDSTARRDAVDDRLALVDALLEEAQVTAAWETELQRPYKELIALLPDGDPLIVPIRERIAAIYLAQAQAAREAQRFQKALAFLDHGSIYHPDSEAFQRERDAVSAAQEALRRQQEEERRLARLEGLKRTLRAKAAAGDPSAAKEILAELQAGLPASDPFLTTDGPQAIAGAYQRLAERAAGRGRWDNAVKLAKAGLSMAPGLPALEEALERYTAEQAREAKVEDLKRRLSKPDQLRPADIEPRLAELKTLFPKRYADLVVELAEAAAGGILAMDAGTPAEVRAMNRPVRAFREIFPDRFTSLERRLGRRVGDQVDAVSRRDPTEAAALLEAAKKLLPGDPTLARIRIKVPSPPSRLAQTGLDQVSDGALGAARKTLDEVLRKEPDASNLPALRQALEEKQTQAQAAYQQFLRYKQAGQARTGGKPHLRRAVTLWTDNETYRREWKALTPTQVKRGECSPALAGKGRQARATCYDFVASKRKGPVMVVVPTGEGFERPFAIGKYEVSVGDYNTFCRLSGRCTALSGEAKLPVTGISLKDAESYARWLSEQAGARYRLPTEGEWEYAARAGNGKQGGNFNCRVVQGGKVIKGYSLVNVVSREQNAWGLANHVGNAQEWARGSGGAAARGGAFEDPLSKCSIDLSKPHDGKPDAVTGFRLLRELG